MRVRVNAKDIQDGERSHSLRCPVALALVRQTGAEWEVLGTVAYRLDQAPRYSLPPAARAWIRHFDAGLETEPFAFELAA